MLKIKPVFSKLSWLVTSYNKISLWLAPHQVSVVSDLLSVQRDISPLNVCCAFLFELQIGQVNQYFNYKKAEFRENSKSLYKFVLENFVFFFFPLPLIISRIFRFVWSPFAGAQPLGWEPLQ